MSEKCRKRDWNTCIFCEKVTSEKLVNPLFSKRPETSEYSSGYEKIAKYLQLLHDIDSLPPGIDFESLDEGDGIEQTLRKNQAKWHRSCGIICSKMRYERALLKRKSKDESTQCDPSVKTRAKVGRSKEDLKIVCIFCEKDGGILHKASTSILDHRVRSAAIELQDRKLLAKLACGGDMHAMDAVYHASCLAALYNRVRTLISSNSNESESLSLEAIALAELVSYIEEYDEKCVFLLSNLTKLYSDRLKELGADCPERINSTRLKERLLSLIPDLKAHSDGKEVQLTFDANINAALKLASSVNFDFEAMHLAKTASLVRRDMFKPQPQFNGSFEKSCQLESVPASLLALVSMILEGPSIKKEKANDEPDESTSSAALTISQLLIFNATNRKRETKVSSRHSVKQETPLPLYIGSVIHAETRKKQLVDKLYRLGLSVSYDRVMQVSTDLGNAACTRYAEEGVVCPTMLMQSLFATGNVDNVDHDPSSRTANSAFHGTAITMTQHPTAEQHGTDRNKILITEDLPKSKVLSTLPEYYTDVQPVDFHEKKDQFSPKIGQVTKPAENLFNESVKSEYQWLNRVEELLNKEKREEKEYISWSGHFASMQQEIPRPPAITGLLPLFQESAHTAATIQHSMKVIAQATQHLNPGQTPVICMDQPLYALAKQIQWNSPDLYGEDKYLVMMGGLHIEMASLKMLGHWLKNSGWDAALVQADVTTPGRADAILKGSHITRARYAHQVSASALFICQKHAYQAYLNSCGYQVPLDFTNWVKRHSAKYPQFRYWATVLDLELLVLEFVRSIREGKFSLYIQILGKLMPWFFVLDLINYSRWLPVHIRDLMALSKRHPNIHKEFSEGKFVVQKTKNAFSMIALDQNHEQQNEIIKGDGGAVGLTENPTALRRWMVAGPEVARVVQEFESTYIISKQDKHLHHEQVPHVQNAFQKDVTDLINEIKAMGNPFEEDSNDLLVLDTKDIMPSNVVEAIKTAKAKGESQYATYVEERLNKCSTPITDVIKKNNLPLFGSSATPSANKDSKMVSLKNDCNLFSRLYISCQARQGNLEEFFRHENQACPPSLSNGNCLRSGQKSDLLSCLDEGVTERCPQADVVILDGAAVVNMLPPKNCKTFQDYANSVFVPYVTSQGPYTKRVDIVWDQYLDNSLKSNTRMSRGAGVRRRVTETTALPANWQSFLRCNENKAELFRFLAQCTANTHTNGLELVSTYDNNVISSNKDLHKEGIAPCNHEEADTRIFVHVKHAIVCGHRRITIRTVDTDVVVLAIAYMSMLDLNELWIAFGVGRHLRYLPVHQELKAFKGEMCHGLPFFHSLTGCDTVSFFAGKGKKTAWNAWKSMPEVSETFCRLSKPQSNISDQDFSTIERFVVILYSRSCPHVSVNEARQSLFAQGTRTIENIPPTRDALHQHIKRAAFQACQVWGQALEPIQELPSPSEWGWTECEDGWKPIWTTIPPAGKVCSELIKCSCKKACRGLCKCTKANLGCTALCKCGGNCFQE